LLADANCAYDIETALLCARELEQYGVYWFEEPVASHDFKGYQRLAQESNVKIATGENLYTLADFETLATYAAAAIFNVDAAICPGYDIALDVCNMAAEHGISIAPHGCQELQLSLAAGVGNGEFLEYYPPEVDPLRGDIFQPQLKPDRDGFVTVPDTPGIGFELNMQLLNRYRVG
jgi:L-alanine-DL-glutamate epimerase-like enolase superfamily enzyme